MDDLDPEVDIYCALVTASFDPNDKRGMPGGLFEDTNYVYPNGKLEYVIRFQNTGTDTAFKVVIRDTLSEELAISTVKSGVASHRYVFKKYDNNILEWTFNNILLPDSNVNEPESHGFISFSIRQKPNLPDETEITNSAAIYFDFNEAVITNQTLHIVHRGIVDGTHLDKEDGGTTNNGGGNNPPPNGITNVGELDVQLYPNPNQGDFTIRYNDSDVYLVSITDISGKQVYRNEGFKGSTLNIDLRSLPSGMYFVQTWTTQQSKQKIWKVLVE